MTTFATVHADDALLVLNKPTGLLTVPGVGPDKQDCLATRVQRDYPSARIVHRLDRDTSGLIVMALDPQTHRRLSQAFEQRKVTKQYRAIVHGQPSERAGTIDLPLRKDMARKCRHIVDYQHGKPAKTHWRIIDSNSERTLLELEPVTGRSHQLRVHLAAIGHPIVGDPLYGDSDGADAQRLMLHASALGFAHPADGRAMRFESRVPFAL
jgi:tRNA pseudouridine32 synthase/23S rRNA pseudouridine746 synthase